MLNTQHKTAKMKSNSKKKSSLNKTQHLSHDQSKHSRLCNVGTQTIDILADSSSTTSKKLLRDNSTCKSLENILHLTHDEKMSMPNTDFSILYGIYKNLFQKLKTNNDLHTENYCSLLNEIQKFNTQMNEQEMCHKSLIKLLTSITVQHRVDRKVRMRKSSKVDKMLRIKTDRISSLINKLQCLVDKFEAKNLAVEAKMEELMEASRQNQLKKKKSKKSFFCCCT